MMDEVGKPRGLIRYTTENALEKHFRANEVLQQIMRPRIIVYLAVLILICVATAWSLATRVPLMVDVIRDRSTLLREADDGSIENVFNLKFMNTTERDRRYRLAVDGLAGVSLLNAQLVEVASAENREVTVVVRVSPGTGNRGPTPSISIFRPQMTIKSPFVRRPLSWCRKNELNYDS